MTAVTEAGHQKMRSVRIEGLGVATQLSDGNVRVNYLDGSCLVLRAQSDTVEYCPVSAGGQWQVFTQSSMPATVRTKLASMPLVLETLMSSGVSNR